MLLPLLCLFIQDMWRNLLCKSILLWSLRRSFHQGILLWRAALARLHLWHMLSLWAGQLAPKLNGQNDQSSLSGAYAFKNIDANRSYVALRSHMNAQGRRRACERSRRERHVAKSNYCPSEEFMLFEVDMTYYTIKLIPQEIFLCNWLAIARLTVRTEMITI